MARYPAKTLVIMLEPNIRVAQHAANVINLHQFPFITAVDKRQT